MKDPWPLSGCIQRLDRLQLKTFYFILKKVKSKAPTSNPIVLSLTAGSTNVKSQISLTEADAETALTYLVGLNDNTLGKVIAGLFFLFYWYFSIYLIIWCIFSV